MALKRAVPKAASKVGYLVGRTAERWGLLRAARTAA
jgi:hypothetical protein